MRDDFDRLLEEELKNPEFKKEWNALEPEFNIIQAMMAARKIATLHKRNLQKKPASIKQTSANLKMAMPIPLSPFYNDLLREWICS